MPKLLEELKNRSLKDKTLDLIISLRPTQWLKNTVVFAAIIFSRDLFIPASFYPVLFTFVVFSIASSAMYLINDVVDKETDKLHFSKRLRPIASGKIQTNVALTLAFFLIILSLAGASYLSNFLLFILLIYFATQLSYTFWLKNIIILDILAISLAFMLRVFAGSVVVVVPLSAWLILTTIMLALFLAIGKRRSELTLLTGTTAFRHRRALLSYPSQLLDGLVVMMATSTLITYSLFTFNAPELVQKEFFASFFPRTLSSLKLLMATIPIVIYGVIRYLYLIFEKSEGDSPEKVLLADRPLFASVLLWLVLVLLILYFFSI